MLLSRQVKDYLEEIYDGKVTEGVRFNGLHFDFYYEPLRLAINVYGRQHYEFTPSFHSTVRAFKQQQERDEEKRSICAERGITLLELPYWLSVEEALRLLALADAGV